MARVIKPADAKRRITTPVDRYRLSKPYEWHDPYPDVLGTKPEKILFARLMVMQIPFIFQGYTTINIPELDFIKDYRPDFIIPGLNLIIQVQGAYFHSLPAAIEQDAYVQALYQMMGFRVNNWWDFEIESNLDALFAADPQLARYAGATGGRIIQAGKQSYKDDLKGLRTRNRNRAIKRGKNTFVGTSRRKIRKGISSYAP